MSNIEYISAEKGLLLGNDDKGKHYISEGYQHVLLLAPAGGGKGVSFVIPNLLSWNESVIVHDIKCENYELTSGWRASQKQEIYTWNPLSSRTHRYNPLDFISKDQDKMVDDAQKIAHLLVKTHCHMSGASSRSLLTGIIIYLIETKHKVISFGEITRMLTRNIADELSKSLDSFKNKIHPTCKMFLESFLGLEAKKRSKIVSTLLSNLELFTNPIIDHATSASDFNIANFKKRKTTLYVGLHPQDINRLQPLMQFFYEYAANQLLQTTDDSHGIAFFMDEFHTLGKMDDFITSMPYFRGNKIRLCLIASDLNEIKHRTSDSYLSTVISNSTFKIIYRSSNAETVRIISEISGGHITVNHLLNLNKKNQVLLIDDTKQILAIENQKYVYYDDATMKSRIVKPV